MPKVRFTGTKGAEPVLRQLRAGVLLGLKHRPAIEKWNVSIMPPSIRFIVDGKRLYPQMRLPDGMIGAITWLREHSVGLPTNLRYPVRDEVIGYLNAKGY